MRFPKRGQIHNTEWAEFLKASLIFLWDGQTNKDNKNAFICFALGCLPSHYNKDVVLALVEEINIRLGDYIFFHNWYKEKVNPEPSSQELQQARIDWVEDMIEEFR